jgi:hypothetical protein
MEKTEVKKSKLSLDDFRLRSSTESKEALEAVTGGILGACHDSPPSGTGHQCTGSYSIDQ